MPLLLRSCPTTRDFEAPTNLNRRMPAKSCVKPLPPPRAFPRVKFPKNHACAWSGPVRPGLRSTVDPDGTKQPKCRRTVPKPRATELTLVSPLHSSRYPMCSSRPAPASHVAKVLEVLGTRYGSTRILGGTWIVLVGQLGDGGLHAFYILSILSCYSLLRIKTLGSSFSLCAFDLKLPASNKTCLEVNSLSSEAN